MAMQSILKTTDRCKNKKNRYFLTVLFTLCSMLWFAQGTVCYAYTSTTGTVTYTSVKIREKADTTSAVLGGAVKGDTVTITNEVTGSDGKKWYEVTVNAAVKGYIRSDLVEKAKTTQTTQSSQPSPSAPATTGATGTVAGTGATIIVRTEPSISSTVQATVDSGMIVTVLKSKKGANEETWYEVKFNKNNHEYKGYIRSDLLKVSGTIPTEAAGNQTNTADNATGGTSSGAANTTSASGKSGTVKGTGVNVRSTASLTGTFVTAVHTGTVVTITDVTTGTDEKTWYKVDFIVNGESISGYIRSDFITVNTSTGEVNNTPATPSAGDGASSAGKKTGAVKGLNINVRKEPVTGELVCQLSTGYSVTISEEALGSDGHQWYYITFTYNNTLQSGYIRSDFITVEKTAEVPLEQENQSGKLGVIKGTSVRIRETAVNGTVIGQLHTGHEVAISSEVKGSDNYTWYEITFTYNNEQKKGYIRSDFITVTQQLTESDADFETALSEEKFPESYKSHLRVLHQAYPNWKFKAVHTNLKWEDAVAAESKVGLNLVSSTSPASWRSTEDTAYSWEENRWYYFDDAWLAASADIVGFYLDPRNFLNENGIFQFETLEFKDYQNETGVTNVLSGSFMNGSYAEADGEEKSYANTFLNAGKENKINPYHLAARCYQEQGKGMGDLISGSVSDYKNIYNYFNVGAYASDGNTAVVNGLICAAQEDGNYLRPWTTRYASIVGGSKFIAERYVERGQDTLYFQKFNVVNNQNGLYSHQYMSNIQAATSEAAKMRKAYVDLNADFIFEIPIYEEMPETACAQPESTANPNNYINSLTVEGYDLMPVFSPSVDSYFISVTNDVGSVKIEASPVASGSSISGTGDIALAVGNNVIQINCKSQSGNIKTYTITITRAE